MTTEIDVVIPTLDAASTIEDTLASLAGDDGGLRLNVIVCDGGSRDDTATVAHRAGAALLSAARGRGSQLAAGAAAGRASWLLFLHADTRLGSGWRDGAARFVADPANAGRAGYFRLRFDTADRRAARIERLAAWRSAVLGLPYGDQALLISRSFHDRVGGFRPLPLMEDVDIVRRIGRRRLVALDAEAVTSARRYERDGWWARPVRNLACLALYFAGIPPVAIRRLYDA
ncbi:MAG: TIGR04283 family arsenosugar biosynthesis glycosyltransferase [Pseudomonadota bacterium]